MDPLLTIQRDILRFREIVSQIASSAVANGDERETVSQLLTLMQKYSASYDTFIEMANMLIKNAETIFPFLLIHTRDELLTILSESRAGGQLYEQGLKGIIKRKFKPLNSVETVYILFFELFCTSCIMIEGKVNTLDDSALNMQAKEIKTVIANLRQVFSNVAATELTIDKTISMIKSVDENITLSEKDIEDILSGRGRLTLCTTDNTLEARQNAENEKIEYVVQNHLLTFFTRIGIDVNIEVAANPSMLSSLRNYDINFVEDKERNIYIIDYNSFRSLSDFTFEQLIALSPFCRYFTKAINCGKNEEIAEGTFAKVKAYNATGKIQNYTLPEPIKLGNN